MKTKVSSLGKKWVKKVTISNTGIYRKSQYPDWKLDFFFFQNYLGFRRTDITNINKISIHIT